MIPPPFREEMISVPKRRSRHPVLRFIAARRLWLALVVLLAFLAAGIFRLTSSHYDAVAQWPLFVAAIAVGVFVLALGEWINLQLSMERLLRRLAHSEGDDS
jgi:hypothetical protein